MNQFKKKDINYLFFKVWRNQVLRKEIISHLRLYWRHFNTHYSFSLYGISNYKNRDYLDLVTIIDEPYSEYEEISPAIPFETLPTKPFPYGIREIKFESSKFKLSQLDEETIPTSVISITFIDCALDKENVIPSSCIEMEIIGQCEIKENAIPNSVTSIKIGDGFSQIIVRNMLPNNLKTLSFGNDFDRSIDKDVLPNSLTHLAFGHLFNKPIGLRVLPKNLKVLSFGFHFNQSIGIGVLPRNLKDLSFGYHFNQSIGIGVLPKYLKSLNLDKIENPMLLEVFLPSQFIEIKMKAQFKILSFNLKIQSINMEYIYHIEDASEP
ncbi:hypothetical protein ACTA71_009373 [Dictyostelium dimigraforme]